MIDLDSPGQLGGHMPFSEKFASNLGILINIISAAFSVFFAMIMDRLKYKYKYRYIHKVMDRFKVKKKAALCVLYLSAGIILVFCSLLAEDVIEMGDDATFKSFLSCLLVLGISLATAGAPIATEFCVDLCQNVSAENIGNAVVNQNGGVEGWNLFISGSWLTLWFNLVALAFFLAFQIPGVRNFPYNIPAEDSAYIANR